MRSSLLFLAAAACSSAYTCNDDDGCEQLGKCVQGACSCLPGFTGPSCGQLDLAPANGPSGASMMWPTFQANAAQFASAWGFSTTFDPSDGKYHAAAAVACGGNGVVADGGGDSWIAHLTGDGPAGPWTFVNMLVPQTTFNPHLATAPDGSFALIFRVNLLVNTTLCAGNGTAPADPSLIEGSAVSPNSIVSGDPEKGTSIYVATAKTMAGPWTVSRINITLAGDTHKSNPAIFPLPQPVSFAGQLMRWGMAYRFNPPGAYREENSIALAADVTGPYLTTANITAGGVPPGNNEDPFLWVHPAQPTVGHVLWHNKQNSYHAWGPLDGSAPWLNSPTGATIVAYNTNVTMADGTTLQLLRRERPELRFRGGDVAQGPEWLYTGVVAANNTAFSFAQPVHPLNY